MTSMVKTVLKLVFDGGSLGNPGKGYGSFRLSVDGVHLPIRELQLGDYITNNQAEYRTLLESLNEAIQFLIANDLDPSDASISIVTDSKLVVEQVNGRWKVKNEGLKPLRTQAQQLLGQFGAARISWQPRKETVKVLGH
jgi:ribonuclease HI